MFGGGWGGMRGLSDFLGFGVPQARLPGEVQPCAAFPLGLMYTEPVRRHPGFLNAEVSDAHQIYCNLTIDVHACLRVKFPPLGGQATG